ncbi:kinase-like domain-containing protein [Rhizophagus irregularis DAOM 181602=DAOM 197198]|nr:kinase-like domain-containing protein [Rhizophagus irregularis DAOM 181602=DAOM 197198]
MNKGNEAQVQIELEFNNLNILDKDSNSMNIDQKNCSYCNKPFTEVLWCKECDPHRMIEDINQIGEGGFSKVYSATWIDGPKIYGKGYKRWEKNKSESNKVALKRLNGSENMSAEYLNEIKILWELCRIDDVGLSFYGMTKDPETEELIIISEYADEGNLRSVLLHNFNNILWKDKLMYLFWITRDCQDSQVFDLEIW